VFKVKPDGTGEFVDLYLSGFKENFKYEVSTEKMKDGWSAIIKIPFSSLNLEGFKPFKVNISRRGSIESKWVNARPLKGRLIYGDENPEDFGWIVFE
jgi:hypothetical protein